MMQKKETTLRQRIIIISTLLGIGLLVGVIIGFSQFIVPTSSPEIDEEAVDTLPTLAAADEIPPTPQTQTPLRPDGSPYPSLYIPQANISEYIIESLLRPEGWQVDHLGDRIGHLQGTSWVNEGGNVVLAGHIEDRDGNPSIFANIGDLEIGTLLTINDNNAAHSYRVTDVRIVDATDLSVVYPQGRETLTLITCTGYDFFSDTYQERIVVSAERVNAPVDAAPSF